MSASPELDRSTRRRRPHHRRHPKGSRQHGTNPQDASRRPGRCRRPQPHPHRLRRRRRLRRQRQSAAVRSPPRPPPARSATGCGTPTSCRPTRRAPTRSSKNPNINVKITQYGWDDYWSKLTNGFVAGTAPDVFTDHLSKYPEFVSQEQLVPAGRHAEEGRGRHAASTSRVWPTCGSARTASATACRRTSTPSRCSTTRSWSTDGRRTPTPTCRTLTWNPDRRRHLRENHRPPDRRQERQARRRAGLRQEQGQGLRLRPRRRLGRRQRPDPVEHVHRQHRAGPTPTRTRGAPTTTTTTRSSRRPWAGSRSLIEKGYMPSVAAVTGQSSAPTSTPPASTR